MGELYEIHRMLMLLEGEVKRLKKLLPPQLQDEDPNGQAPIPPQVQQQMEQAKQMIAQLSQQLHQTVTALQAAQTGNDTKFQVAAMQEETKRLIALLTTGSKNAAVELQHTIGVLDAQADRDHAMTMAQLPPQAPPGQPGQPPQPGAPTPSIQPPDASSGLAAGLAPQGQPPSAGGLAG